MSVTKMEEKCKQLQEQLSKLQHRVETIHGLKESLDLLPTAAGPSKQEEKISKSEPSAAQLRGNVSVEDSPGGTTELLRQLTSNSSVDSNDR